MFLHQKNKKYGDIAKNRKAIQMLLKSLKFSNKFLIQENLIETNTVMSSTLSQVNPIEFIKSRELANKES